MTPTGGVGSFALALLLVAPQPAARPGRATPASTASTLEALRAQHAVPSLAVIVLKDGAIVDRAAVGVRKLGDPMRVTLADQFHLGSCTKSMTASLAALLVEDGKIAWTTTIAEAFPELKGRLDPGYASATLRQLLAHRGGAPDRPPDEAWIEARRETGTPMEQRQAFATAVLTRPPQAPPGTAFIYSNQGIVIAGVMIERAGGKPWETLMQERIFTPLGMTSAGQGPPAAGPGTPAQPWGHELQGNRLVPVMDDNPIALGPAGRVHASLEDMARYARVHLGKGRPSEPNALLAASSLHALHAPLSGEQYVGGWALVERPWGGVRPVLAHTGSNGYWVMTTWLSPARDFAVIAATNAGGPAAERACRDAADAMVTRWLS